MKQRLLLFLLLLFPHLLTAQQIPLKGVVTVQNSRVNTGKTEYVPEVSINHPKAKPTATDSHGEFILQIIGLQRGVQTTIEVKPTGKYRDYIIVDDRLIRDVTVGRLTPVAICVQDKKVLEEREKRLIAVTVKKQNEIRERKIAELNKRISALEAANDYTNEHYQRSIDSLKLLAEDKLNALKRIREYAKSMVLINLDEADSIYSRAYRFFEQGELDSVASYLKRHINFEQESKRIQEQLQEAQEKRELAQSLQEQAERQLANAEQAKEQLLKKLTLAAKACRELYQYAQASQYYEQALTVAPNNLELLYTYASYLSTIHEYEKANTYLLRALDRQELLAQKNPKAFRPNLAAILNNLGTNCNALMEYEKANTYQLGRLRY